MPHLLNKVYITMVIQSVKTDLFQCLINRNRLRNKYVQLLKRQKYDKISHMGTALEMVENPAVKCPKRVFSALMKQYQGLRLWT